jgi:putative flippase GtrA
MSGDWRDRLNSWTRATACGRTRALARALPGVGVVLAGTLMILAVVLANGRPAVFPDTDDYFAHGRNFAFEVAYSLHLKARPARPTDPDEIADAKQLKIDEHMSRPVMKARSPWYGLFLYGTQRIGTLWLTTALQGLMAAWTLYLLWRTMAPRAPLWSAYAAQAATAVLSTLPFFAGFAMPDIFAGCCAIGASLLVAAWDRLGRWERIGIALILAFGIMIHGSHGLIVIAVLVPGLILAWLMRTPRPRWLLPLGVIAATFAAAFVGNAGYWKAVELRTGDTPGRPPFLAMRVIADGPGRDYLRWACAHGEHFALCQFRNLPLDNSDQMMWSDRPDRGVFNRGDYAQRVRLEHEEMGFVLKVVAWDPAGVVGAGLKNWWKQLTGVFLDDPLLDPHYYLANPFWRTTSLPWLIDHDHGCGKDHHGCKPRLSSTQSWWLHSTTLILALAAILARMALPDSRRWMKARRFSLDDDLTRSMVVGGLVLIALVANALICGALSGPFPRYQARVAWLAAGVAAAALASALPARREQPAGAWFDALLARPQAQWLLGKLEGSMLRFGLVGVIGFVTDRLFLEAAQDLLGLNYFGGRLVSFPLAVVVTWLLNRVFTFRGPTVHPPLKQALIYACVQIAGGVLNVGVYTLAIRLLPALEAHLLLPLALGSAAGLCVTYVGSRRLAFRAVPPAAV